jgi:GT2 family glycosyltransferase
MAAHPVSVTILICTYNRAGLLSRTLTALGSLRPVPDAEVTVRVVDNRSTDATRAVVEAAARRLPMPVTYDFEAVQGKSFALNRGLHQATEDVVSLIDDDVVPDGNWLRRVVAAFERNDLTFAFGKVLPDWEAPPPPFLLTPEAREIWGPLALLDYGDAPLSYATDRVGRQSLPVGANLAFRRAALVAVGGWRTDLGKVNNSLISGEDYEIFFRMRDAGLYHGLYDPEMIVFHHVPAARVRRQYFRRWFFWQGRTLARVLDDAYDEVDLSRSQYVLRIPRFMYRQFLAQCFRFVKSRFVRDPLRRLVDEVYTVRFAGMFAECWSRGARTGTRRGEGPAPGPLASDD